MNDTMCIYVTIGNSDNKLTQGRWAAFCHSIKSLLDPSRRYTSHLHGVWYSEPNSIYQNAIFCAELPTSNLHEIETKLSLLAESFNQDSIASVNVPTQFVRFITPPGSSEKNTHNSEEDTSKTNKGPDLSEPLTAFKEQIEHLDALGVDLNKLFMLLKKHLQN